MILLYDYTTPPPFFFFPEILRLDKPDCILKEIPCSAVSVEKHVKKSWPSSWFGSFSQRLQWWANLKHIILLKCKPCWIFIEPFIHQRWWLTTVTSILTYPFHETPLAPTLFSSVLLLTSHEGFRKDERRDELSRHFSDGRCQVRAELKKPVAGLMGSLDVSPLDNTWVSRGMCRWNSLTTMLLHVLRLWPPLWHR